MQFTSLNFAVGILLLLSTNINAFPVGTYDISASTTAEIPAPVTDTVDIASDATDADATAVSTPIQSADFGLAPDDFVANIESNAKSAHIETASTDAPDASSNSTVLDPTLISEVSAEAASRNVSDIPGTIAALKKLTPEELSTLQDYFKSKHSNSTISAVGTTNAMAADDVQNKGIIGGLIKLFSKLFKKGKKKTKKAAKKAVKGASTGAQAANVVGSNNPAATTPAH